MPVIPHIARCVAALGAPRFEASCIMSDARIEAILLTGGGASARHCRREGLKRRVQTRFASRENGTRLGRLGLCGSGAGANPVGQH